MTLLELKLKCLLVSYYKRTKRKEKKRKEKKRKEKKFLLIYIKTGALDFGVKEVGDIMTPIDQVLFVHSFSFFLFFLTLAFLKVFMLGIDETLTHEQIKGNYYQNNFNQPKTAID